MAKKGKTGRPDAAAYAGRYLAHIRSVLASLDAAAIGRVAGVLDKARRRNKKILLAGNGGSAATADHMANDLSIGCGKAGGRPFRAISLAANHSVTTALANDTGYENIFTGQMDTLLDPGDVLIVISASGNSPNVVNAVRFAKRKKAVTIAFAGFDGGTIARLADHAVVVRTPKGHYGPVEDAHMVLDHLLMSYFTRLKV